MQPSGNSNNNSQPPTGPTGPSAAVSSGPKLQSGAINVVITGPDDPTVSGVVPQTLADATMVAMHGEEAARAASFGRVVAILCGVGLGFLMLDEKSRPLRTAMIAAQVLLGLIGIWVWSRSRDAKTYSPFVFRVFGVSAGLAAIVFMQYFGVFSPVTTVVILGLAFFGQGDDVRALFPIAIFVIAGYAVSAGLIALRILPDVGMFMPQNVPLAQRMTMTLMVAAVMTMQLVQARLSRKATLDAISRSNEAVRVIRTREAQLDEARDNLDAALRAGAGKRGRFSGELVGRFRLDEVIGRGAMGEIYAASVEGAEPRAAVKLLQMARRDDPEIVRRFLREAEIATRVRGPNLVEVLEAGTAPDGSLYIAMELLVGTDLAALLRERTMLPVREVVTLIEDVARGLELLHKASVVHRDLKPQNLFLTMGPPPSWKILDYGVSKLVDGSATLTMGALIGTPGYMSPEQAEGGEVDVRSDVFALGAVAYRALTGRRPFVGSDTPQVLYQVVYGMPVRPREIMPSLDRDLELVLGIALAKKPSHRFGSAASFAKAFRLASTGSLDASTRHAAERLARLHAWSHDPVADAARAIG